MRRRGLRAWLVLAAVVCWLAPASRLGWSEGFDAPVKKIVVDLGHSPDQPGLPNLHRHLSCFYFRRFMVKQLDDDGNEGALRIAITATLAGQSPPCTRAGRGSDKVISDGWSYYWGVKRGVVFLTAADGSSGGILFHAFAAGTGKRIFKDTVLLSKEDLDFLPAPRGQMLLQYQRVFSSDCSVPEGGMSCWTKIQNKAGLRGVPLPKCDYAGADGYMADPSVISFPVQTTLFPRPSTTRVAGSVQCWAAE